MCVRLGRNVKVARSVRGVSWCCMSLYSSPSRYVHTEHRALGRGSASEQLQAVKSASRHVRQAHVMWTSVASSLRAGLSLVVEARANKGKRRQWCYSCTVVADLSCEPWS
eukprot:11756099-Alexandrium_andersonii.AAC.1